MIIVKRYLHVFSFRAFLTSILLCMGSCGVISEKPKTQESEELRSDCLAIPDAVREARRLMGKVGESLPQCKSLARDDFVALGSALLSEEVSEKELSLEGEIFRRIGLIPASYPYARCILGAYTAEASAFYSPSRNTIFIPDWFQVPFSILVHEAVHFLQREDGDYTNDERFRGIFRDSALALGAMLEGEALNIEERYLKEHSDGVVETALPESGRLEMSDVACEIPSTLKRLFYFQYDYGALFWPRLYRIAPEITRMQVFQNPPHTTREIIDLKVYVRRLRAAESEELEEVPKSEGTACEAGDKTEARTLGEYALRSLFESVLPRNESFLAARGLMSDCLSMKGDTGEGEGLEGIQWALSFQTDADAQEAWKALERIGEKNDMRVTGGLKDREITVRFDAPALE